MSTFVDLAALVGACAVVVLAVLLVRSVLAPKAVPPREPAPAPRPVGQRDWTPFTMSVGPAIGVLGLSAVAAPLVLWGVALHRSGGSATALGCGVAIVGLLGIAAVHAMRRSRGDR